MKDYPEVAHMIHSFEIVYRECEVQEFEAPVIGG